MSISNEQAKDIIERWHENSMALFTGDPNEVYLTDLDHTRILEYIAALKLAQQRLARIEALPVGYALIRFNDSWGWFKAAAVIKGKTPWDAIPGEVQP